MEITREDLRQLRLNLIDDMERIIAARIPVSTSEEKESIDWLRSKAIRKIMNISPATLQNLRISGKIRYTKIMGSYYYNKSDLMLLFNKEK